MAFSGQIVDFSPVTKAGSASVGQETFSRSMKEAKNDIRRFQKSSQVEETCTVEVQKCWCGSWPGGAVVCSPLQPKRAATDLMHVCPATFQMLQTWPQGGGCGSGKASVHLLSGRQSVVVQASLEDGRNLFLSPPPPVSLFIPPCYVCYLCFPWPVFSPPSSVSSIASFFLSLFLHSSALCLCDPFPWPRLH